MQRFYNVCLNNLLRGDVSMAKFNSLQEYLDTLNVDALNCYKQLVDIINSIDLEIKQKLFAGQIAFYIEKNLNKTFHSSPIIIMTFFKDHVNIFAKANISYMDLLSSYNFTQKGTLQIDYNKKMEKDILIDLFKESLH